MKIRIEVEKWKLRCKKCARKIKKEFDKKEDAEKFAELHSIHRLLLDMEGVEGCGCEDAIFEVILILPMMELANELRESLNNHFPNHS